MVHVVFIKDAPLAEIVAGRKRFEFRLSFRRLACECVREGDLLLLKRVGGEVEAACRAGRVEVHHDIAPDGVADLARRYADLASLHHFGPYVPPTNAGRPVNAAVIELLDVRDASLPPGTTPRGVRSGWVAGFDDGHAARGMSW